MAVLAVRAPLGWLGPGRLVENPTVVIGDGRIVFAGPAADLAVLSSSEAGVETASGVPYPDQPDQEIDVEGFLMPAAADRHVHIGLSNARAVLAGGVTAVRDLGWPPERIFPLAEASEAPGFVGPFVQAAGPMITARAGYPARASWAPAGTAAEVRGAEEAAAVARDLLRRGATFLKVALNAEAGPTLSDAELVAVCEAAHAAGTLVTCHAQGRGQAQRAVGAGVDEFAHCPWSESLSDALIAAMARGVRIVSTLDIHSYGRDTPDLRTATENLSRFIAAGGTVAYGTDLGNGPIPAGIHPGEAWHLRRAGLSPEGVLQALIRRPLAPGEPGDVIALEGNPLEDLGALGQVRLVVQAGRLLA